MSKYDQYVTFYQEFTDSHDRDPSLREFELHMDDEREEVMHYLSMLALDGYIARARQKRLEREGA